MAKYAFVGGILVDGTGAAPVQDSLVLVDDDKITYAGPRTEVPAGYEVEDISGKTIMPGLIDTHLHFSGNLTDDDKDTYWATNDRTKSATITFTWSTEQTLRYLQMMEYIKLGQRIKNWSVEYTTDGATWTRLAPSVQTTTVGYKRILPLNGSTSSSYGKGFKATGLRITIVDSRACPLLSNISIY